jgi:HSP20 family protein
MKPERISVMVMHGGRVEGAGSDDLSRREREVASLFERLLAPVYTFRSAGGCTWHPFTDVIETPTHFLIRMELAGIDLERLQVRREGPCVVVRGQREESWRGSDVTCHQVEIAHGAFERVVRLPVDIDEDRMRAEYGRVTGFLEITVEKERP